MSGIGYSLANGRPARGKGRTPGSAGGRGSAGWGSHSVKHVGREKHRRDLALIDPQYRYWWVIEVELIGHSLQGHVIPQVRTFVEGRYDKTHAAALAKRSKKLDPQKLAAMMLGEAPNVVVISNRVEASCETPPMSKFGDGQPLTVSACIPSARRI